jgi:uncharacterized membrane protein
MQTVWSIAPCFLAAVAVLGFSWLKAPSPSGQQVMDQIDGFKQYLGVAEEDRLNFLNPPEKTPELFEKFLPYAIALDVENAWAKRFAGMLAVAAAAGATVGSWYDGDRRYRDDPVAFADHLGDDLSNTIAAAASSPASSGGSGGSSGSSGGGSSGGGGGW